MTRPTIDQLRGIGDFQALYRWNLNFSKFPAEGSFPDSEDLNLRCESVEMPKLTGQSVETNIRGHKVKHAGIHNYTNVITLTFVETVDSIVAEAIREWREICWKTQEGTQEDKENYEALIKIDRLNAQDNVIYTYELVGCFLEDYDLGQLDGASSDFMKPTMTISYDYFKDKKL